MKKEFITLIFAATLLVLPGAVFAEGEVDSTEQLAREIASGGQVTFTEQGTGSTTTVTGSGIVHESGPGEGGGQVQVTQTPGGDLQIQGDSGNNQIQVQDPNIGGNVQINSGGGNDTLLGNPGTGIPIPEGPFDGTGYDALDFDPEGESSETGLDSDFLIDRLFPENGPNNDNRSRDSDHHLNKNPGGGNPFESGDFMQIENNADQETNGGQNPAGIDPTTIGGADLLNRFNGGPPGAFGDGSPVSDFVAIPANSPEAQQICI